MLVPTIYMYIYKWPNILQTCMSRTYMYTSYMYTYIHIRIHLYRPALLKNTRKSTCHKNTFKSTCLDNTCKPPHSVKTADALPKYVPKYMSQEVMCLSLRPRLCKHICHEHTCTHLYRPTLLETKHMCHEHI